MSRVTRTYLDYNATAPIREEVIDLVTEVMREGGNPSSVHGSGRIARARVDVARKQVADLVNALPPEVVFTGGGTEATDLAINGVAPANGVTDLILCSVEHPASFGAGGQFNGNVHELPVTASGTVDLAAAEALFDELKAKDAKVMVVVQAANNETGVIQPVKEIAQLVRDRELGLVHCDAVQAAGKIPVDLVMMGADTAALSGHKIGGPLGVGALILREGVAISPRIVGGGQEMGRRSGTENVPGIAGFGMAAELAQVGLRDFAELAKLRDQFEADLNELAPSIVIFGKDATRLPNTSNFSVPGVSAETALMMLDLAGLEVSSGSACSSGKVGKNRVLAAMGVESSVAMGALRISFGWGSDISHAKKFIDVWKSQVSSVATTAEAF